MRYTFRGYSGLSFSNRWGHFLDWQMSKTIHSYGDWVAYPKDSLFENKYLCTAVTTSSDGHFLYSALNGGYIVKYDLENGKRVKKLESQAISTLAFHRSGIIVSGHWDNFISVWNAYTCQLKWKLEGHKQAVISLDISDDGSKLISGSVDNRLRLWCLKTGVCLKSFPHSGGTNQAVCFIDGLFLAGPDDRALKAFDTESGRVTMKVQRSWLTSLTHICVNRDRSLVACMLDREIMIFEWPSMEMIQSMRKRAKYGCFHPLNPDIIAFGHGDESCVRVFHARDGREIRCFDGVSASDICFTPDGRRLIAVGEGGIGLGPIQILWDMSDLC